MFEVMLSHVLAVNLLCFFYKDRLCVCLFRLFTAVSQYILLVQDGNMARRKFLSDEEQLEILFNDDSGDELIPELDFSDRDSDCGNENSETLVHDGAEVSESESIPDMFFENLTPNQISHFFNSCKH
jgi:hypothetical protein